jgi:aldehyde dehydrogenase (NAD+)
MTAGASVFETEDPFRRVPVATFVDANAADVDRAVIAAQDAFAGPWARFSGAERATLLHSLADLVDQHAPELGRLETRENGKLLSETTAQAHFAASCYRYYAGMADKIGGDTIPVGDPNVLDVLVREPVGVCALLISWNSPMQLLANKLAPAIAAGNTVVVKPSEFASSSVVAFGRFLEQAGFPGGVVNIVTGAGPLVGKTLSSHPGIDLVSLTGGVHTGRSVTENSAATLPRLVLELGGKSPNIVFEDADLDKALQGVAAGIFAAAGQTCVAGSRLLVQETIADAFLQELIERAESIRLGDPMIGATEMGPLANEPQFARVSAYIDQGIRDGVKVLTRGRPYDPEGPLFVPPTIFVDDHNTASVARDEIFGPVLTAMRFRDEGEAVRIANETPFGLAAGVWTTDAAKGFRVAGRIRAGTVWINTYRRVFPGAPFGGYRGSGIGRERGLEGLREYTQTKNIMIDVGE